MPCETRWNSYFHLYEHIIKHYEDINKALQNINRTELTISRPQKEVLTLIVDVMDFFSEATNILQREETSTSNRLIPVIDSLENALIQTRREKVAINALCERLLNSLRTRFSCLLQSKLYQAATALDPRIKLSFTDNEKEGKVFLFSSNVVKQSIKSLLPPQLVEQDNRQPTFPTTRTVTAMSEPTAKKTRLLDFCSICESDESRVVKTLDFDTELQTYFDQPRFDMDTNPIKFWTERKKTQLSALALQLLSVPCSSAPVERLFSTAGVILSQRRSRIGSAKLEKLVFIK